MSSLQQLAIGALATTLSVMATIPAGPWDVASSAGFRPDTTITATDPAARCVSRRGAWVNVPFTLVNLGPQVGQVAMQERMICGPRTRAVVNDSAQWVDVWHTATDIANDPDRDHANLATDTVSVPRIEFGRNALVFAATKGFTAGEEHIQVSSIRRCRRTGVVVVTVFHRNSLGHNDYPGRGFVAVRVSKHLVSGRRVVFLDTGFPR